MLPNPDLMKRLKTAGFVARCDPRKPKHPRNNLPLLKIAGFYHTETQAEQMLQAHCDIIAGKIRLQDASPFIRETIHHNEMAKRVHMQGY